jgi:hypothetical protein
MTKDDLLQAGKVAAFALIAWATPPRCEQKLVGLEFLGQAERWQHRWPIELLQRTTIRFYPVSAGGGRALGSDTWSFIERRISGMFRPGKSTTWSPGDGDAVW